MNAPQREVVRALCDELVTEPGVVYVVLERRGVMALCEAGDRGALLTGPVVSALTEELAPVDAEFVLRLVYDERADASLPSP